MAGVEGERVFAFNKEEHCTWVRSRGRTVR